MQASVEEGTELRALTEQTWGAKGAGWGDGCLLCPREEDGNLINLGADV